MRFPRFGYDLFPICGIQIPEQWELSMSDERRFTHDATARFRINADLMQRASVVAGREGMSLSEFFRAAVRDKTRDIAA